MSYEEIVNQIGQFGRWQKLVFFLASLCSMCSSILTLGFSFIGFTPKFRCFVPECDGADIGQAIYGANHTSFTIPPDAETDDDAHQCERYVYKSNATMLQGLLAGNSTLCSPNYFSNTSIEICDEHVYDKSKYENSFISELDLSPCNNPSDGWPLEVRCRYVICLSM